MDLRTLRHHEIPTVLELWQQADALPSPTDTAVDIAALIARDSAIFLVAETEGRIVGTIVATYDGWRGHIYRLAVAPEFRRQGLARRLVREAEKHFEKWNVKRVIALVDQSNAVAMSFWANEGYTHDKKLTRFYRSLET